MMPTQAKEGLKPKPAGHVGGDCYRTEAYPWNPSRSIDEW
jgi:hypothetical protein